MRIRGMIIRMGICLAAALLALMPGMAFAQDGVNGITLRLISGRYNQEIIPGEETILHMEIRNFGEETVTGINLTAEPPKGWEVEITPASISSLAADDFQTVDISITPPPNTPRNDYQINVIADSSEGMVITTAYLRVETATTIWTWIGVAIGVIVIAGFIYVYRRYGRQ